MLLKLARWRVQAHNSLSLPILLCLNPLCGGKPPRPSSSAALSTQSLQVMGGQFWAVCMKKKNHKYSSEGEFSLYNWALCVLEGKESGVLHERLRHRRARTELLKPGDQCWVTDSEPASVKRIIFLLIIVPIRTGCQVSVALSSELH